MLHLVLPVQYYWAAGVHWTYNTCAWCADQIGINRCPLDSQTCQTDTKDIVVPCTGLNASAVRSVCDCCLCNVPFVQKAAFARLGTHFCLAGCLACIYLVLDGILSVKLGHLPIDQRYKPRYYWKCYSLHVE